MHSPRLFPSKKKERESLQVLPSSLSLHARLHPRACVAVGCASCNRPCRFFRVDLRRSAPSEWRNAAFHVHSAVIFNRRYVDESTTESYPNLFIRPGFMVIPGRKIRPPLKACPRKKREKRAKAKSCETSAIPSSQVVT